MRALVLVLVCCFVVYLLVLPFLRRIQSFKTTIQSGFL